MPHEAFLGLERSLWELELSYNDLTRVPNRALRYLQKLRLLDLTGKLKTNFNKQSHNYLFNRK